MTHRQGNSDRASRIITPEIALGLLDALNVGLLLVDRSGRVMHRNRTAAKLLPAGRKLDELFVPSAMEGGPQSPRSWTSLLSNVVESDQADAVTCVSPWQDSEESQAYHVRMLPLVDGDGPDNKRIVILVDDPTSIRANDRMAVGGTTRDQRLEADVTPAGDECGSTGGSVSASAIPGEAAARVAHELNNPIDAILRYINLAIRLSENVSEPKLHDYLAHSRSGLMRMIEIISDLLVGPLGSSEGAEPVGIRTLIDDSVRTHMLAAESAGVEVSLDVAEGNIHPRYGTRLYQICTNLIRNAIDAMPNGGGLTITAGCSSEADGQTGEESRTRFVIRVADTGVGLPEDVDRVFDTFYSTKARSHGTGLGLAICREYAEAMGGTIEAAHGEAGGAVFTVTLPGSLIASDGVNGMSRVSLLRSWVANGQ